MLNNLIKRAPLAFLVIWYFTGILIDRYFPVSSGFWLIATALLLMLSLIRKPGFSPLFSIIVLTVGIGGLNHCIRTEIPSDHIVNFIDKPVKSWSVSVESCENYSASEQKIIAGEIRLLDKDKISCEGKILLRIKDCSQLFSFGDRISFSAKLNRPAARRNPGEFDYRNYLANHHIFAIVYLSGNEISVQPSEKPYHIRRIANRVKRRIQKQISESVKGEPGAILQALLVGIRGEISDEVEQAFIDSGVIHVLAVSGLHVGYVTLAFWVITGFMRLPLKPRIIITISALAFYVLIVDVKPSVVRAVIMASMVLIAKGWEKQVNVYNSLAAAALIQTIVDPLQLFDMGFQLSFMAVFSIVYIYQRIIVLLPDSCKPINLTSKVMKYIWQIFLVSAAALFGTIPITVFYFQRVPIISLFSNIIVIPLIGVIGALGFAQLLLGFIWSGFNIIYGEVEFVLIEILQKIVQMFARIPGAYIQVPQISVITLLIMYGFLFLLLNIDNKKYRKSLVFTALIVGNFLIWKTVLIKPKLTVTFLDVGQGDAALLELPNKMKILVDCGDRTFRRDYGELVVVPFLQRKGIHNIDILMLSHPHSDHIGGAPVVLRNMKVGQIWESDIIAASKVYREIHYLADSLGIPIRTPNAGNLVKFEEGLYLRFLHPSERFVKNYGRNYNNGSLVCRLEFGEISLLLTGDAEKESEEYLCLWGEKLDANVLKVPHHGSRTSSTLAYLDLIDPEYAVISVGQNNKFKHPAAATIENYRSLGIRLFRTDIDNAVQFSSNGKIVKVINWK